MLTALAYMPFVFGLVAPQLVPFDQTLPVLTDPMMRVKAGEHVLYQ